VNIATYARRNLFRRKGRTILTIIAVAVAVLIFCLIRTVVGAWNVAADEAARDRLATRHKVSIVMQLPKRYIEDVRAIAGVQSATYGNWFASKDPKERTPFFAGFAVDHETWFTVFDEMKVEPAQLAEWKQTPNGAIIGDVLARTLEVKVGDRIVITSDIYPGDWEFKIVGIYMPLRRTVDRNSFVFRWDYLNNDPRVGPSKDQIGWVMSRISDPNASADTSRKIDKIFDEKDDQTLTQSERAFNLAFLGAFSAVLSAFDIISLAILLIMTLILANTIAMSARERTHEYGVLRAIGFSPGSIFGFIVGEAMLVALVGGLVGAMFTFLIINNAIGPAMEENMAGIFPYFRTPMSTLGIAVVVSTILGALSGTIPGILASRRKVVDALRRVD
jgi:putative ABC transport system permease protein